MKVEGNVGDMGKVTKLWKGKETGRIRQLPSSREETAEVAYDKFATKLVSMVMSFSYSSIWPHRNNLEKEPVGLI